MEIGLKEKGRKDTRKMCSEGRKKKKPEASKPMEASKKEMFYRESLMDSKKVYV